MRVLKYLLISLMAVFVLIAGALWYISTQDLSKYDFLEQSVEDFTGRDLTLGGEQRITIWLTSTVTARDVSLSNASWGTEASMVEVGTLRLEFDPFALLFGEVRVKRFVLENTELHLETDADGLGNWEFGEPDATAPEAETGGGLPVKVRVDEVQVVNALVSYRDGSSGETHRLGFDELIASADSVEDPLSLSLKAHYQDQPLGVEGSAGPLLNLFSERPVQVDLTATGLGVTAALKGELEGIQAERAMSLEISASVASGAELANALALEIPDFSNLEASGVLARQEGVYSLQGFESRVGFGDGAVTTTGTVGDLLALTGIELGLEVSAPTMRDFSDVAGAELPDAGPVKVSARLEGAAGRYSVPVMSAAVAESKLEGKGSIDLSQSPRAVRLSLRADTLDLDQLRPQESATSDPATENAEKEQQRPASGKIFSPAPLPFDQLNDLDVEASFKANRLIIGNFVFEDLSVPLTIRDGILALNSDGRLADGALASELNIDANEAPPVVTLNVGVEDFLLGKLMAMSAGPDLVSGGPGDFDLEFRSSGDSVAALMAQSNGHLRLTSGKGRIANTLLDTVGGDIVFGMLSFLVPASEKSQYTQMECVRAFNGINDGLVAVRQLALVSSKSVLQGTGTVNLRDESYDLIATTKARSGVSLSAGDLAGGVYIRGPLSAPKVEVNPEGLAETAAGGTAAVLTGGLSFLAEKVMDTAKAENPCAVVAGGETSPAAAQTTSTEGAAAEQADSASAEPTEEKPKSVIDSVGDGIKGLFGGE